MLFKLWHDGKKANDGQSNPFKWDWSNANYNVGLGFGGSGTTVWGSVGWGNDYGIAVGYNSQQGWGAGMNQNGSTSMYYPGYESKINQRIEQVTEQAVTQAQEGWNYSAFECASIASMAILVDDATVIGAVDDVLIPFVWLGAAGTFVYQNQDLIADKTRDIADAVRRNLTYSYAVYTKVHPSGKVYVGRTSGFGTPDQVVRRRDIGHKYNAEGYGPATVHSSLVSVGPSPDYRYALRGREQQVLDYYGGVGSPMVGNRIRAVSIYNPLGYIYWGASNQYFGLLMPY